MNGELQHTLIYGLRMLDISGAKFAAALHHATLNDLRTAVQECLSTPGGFYCNRRRVGRLLVALIDRNLALEARAEAAEAILSPEEVR